MSDISVLGIGNMGGALVRALGRPGTSVTIWNRSRAKADALATSGIAVAETPAQAFAASPCSILCLSQYDHGRALLDADGSDLSGKTLIQLTTGKPDEARHLAKSAADRNIRYIDGAIMGIPNLVGTPQNLVLYSGDNTAFEDHRTLLEQIGSHQYLGDDAGAASAFDLALLMPVFTMVPAILQGMKVCETEGIPAGQYDAFVREFLIQMIDDTVGKARREGFSSDPSQAEVSVGQVAATVRMLGDYCRDVNIDPGAFESLTRLFQAGVDSGRQDHDWTCAAELRAEQ